MLRKHLVVWSLAVLLSFAGGEALAQAPDTPAPTTTTDNSTNTEPPTESKPLFGNYGLWLKHQEKTLMSLPLWGASMTIPEGYGIMFVGWRTMRPYKRFNKDRELESIVPVISAPDMFEGKGKFFEFVFNFDGRGSGVGGGFQYGITDKLTLGITTYGAFLTIDIHPTFIPGSSDQIGVVTLEDFYEVMKELGRPPPKTHYKSDPIDLGDTTIDLKWNNYRSEYISTAIHGGIITPTAHRADPNQAIIFGLGPDLDTGAGTWGGQFGAIFDVRPPDPAKFITFSLSADGAYFLECARKTPHFPKQNQDVKDYLKSQGVDVKYFPDLSSISSHYYYTPGPWFAVQAGIGMGPASVAYRHGFAGTATFRTDAEGFQELIDSIGLAGYGDDGKLIFQFNVPLTPLYIPGLVMFNMEYSTDGRNFLVFRDVYTIGAGFGMPLNPPERYKFKGAK